MLGDLGIVTIAEFASVIDEKISGEHRKIELSTLLVLDYKHRLSNERQDGYLF
jgi:hypothetical protein